MLKTPQNSSHKGCYRFFFIHIYVKINCVLKYVLYLYIYINRYRYSTNIWFLQSKRKRKKKMLIRRNVFKILFETLHFLGNNMQTTLCMVLMIPKYGKPWDSIYYVYKCKKLKIKIKRWKKCYLISQFFIQH